MRKLFGLVVMLFAVTPSFSQTNPRSKDELIKLLNEKSREIINVVKIRSKGRNMVRAAEFRKGQYGIIYNFTLDETDYSHEFDPSHIKLVREGNMPSESPVGIVTAEFSAELLSNRSNNRTTGKTSHYFSKELYFHFLKVNPDNARLIISLLNELKEAYKVSRHEVMKDMEDMTGTSYWVSENGVSKTYKLDDIFTDNCNIYFFYDLTTSSVNGDKTETCLTVVPARDIRAWMGDVTSHPKSFVFRNYDSGFRHYKKDKDGDYSSAGTVFDMPSFLATPDEKAANVMRALIDQMKESCTTP